MHIRIMHIYTYTCIEREIHKCACMYIYIYIYTHIHMYMHMFVCILHITRATVTECGRVLTISHNSQPYHNLITIIMSGI